MGDDTQEELLQSLVRSFSGRLDDSLIISIASEFQLQDPTIFGAAYAALQDLAQESPSADAASLVQSGPSSSTTHQPGASKNKDGPPDTSACCSCCRWLFQEPNRSDKPSFSAGSGSTTSSSSCRRRSLQQSETFQLGFSRLLSMFSDIHEWMIERSLLDAAGDVNTAIDELLTIQRLQSTGQDRKGIDAFFDPDGKFQEHRRKGKKNRVSFSTSSSDASDIASLGSSTKGSEDIQYISERLGMRFEDVQGIYKTNRCSRTKTVVGLLDQYLIHGVASQDDAGKDEAEKLGKKYKQVPAKYLPTIVLLAGSIPQFADDIATLLNGHFSKRCKGFKGQKMQLDYRLSPLPRDDLVSEDTANSPTMKKKKKKENAVLDSGSATKTGPMSLTRASEMTDNINQARRDAIASATRLRRRGGSNPVYGQAASFYLERAREQTLLAHQASSVAADLAVELQSSSNSIDLHGIPVRDGVRIACQETQRWWQRLGQSKAKKAKEEGFIIITGRGRHNVGGVSPMRQAVAAALEKAGWKMQIQTGRFLITGRS